MIVLLCLASCATEQRIPVLELADPKIFDHIEAEVSKGGWEIKHSLPELKHAKRQHFPLGRNTETHDLESSDGQSFQVLVLNAPAMSMPGEDFALAYLKNPEGKIVHWKSRWLYNRLGNLGTRLLDVNDDGVKEFCFVSKPFERAEQVLSAYCVREDRFEPVIAEHTSLFTVEFVETVLPDGLVLQPQLKGKYGWETDKLYEIPVRVINNAGQDRTLTDCSVWFSSEFYGGGIHGSLDVDKLKPKEATETTVTVRFTRMPHESKLGFMIHRREK
jgi:hypothetical protein